MSDVYVEVFYHLVWATKKREEMVKPHMENLLYSHLRQRCQEMSAPVYALNGMPDHVHLVCSIPASLAVSEFMKRIKGGSSHFISHHASQDPLCWQPGYGVLTFSGRDLIRVVSYVDNQKKHHQEDKLSQKMEHIPSVPEGLSLRR